MQRYGIDQFRDEISWRSYERQRGRYELPEHAAAFLQHAAELKMRPLIIFDYSNPLYDNDGFPNSPEAIEAIRRLRSRPGTAHAIRVQYVRSLERMDRRLRDGRSPGESRRRGLRPFAQADLRCRQIGLSRSDRGRYWWRVWRDTVRKTSSKPSAGRSRAMDAWSIHPYRYPRSPESSDLVGEVKRIAERVADDGREAKTWITEIGWPTHRTSGGSDESEQARHCVRTLALLQSTGVVEKVFWYDFKDDGTRRDYNEHNFGLIRHQTYNCAPKPGMVAMSVFIRMTGEATFRRLQRDGPAYVAWYNRTRGKDVAVAWTEEGTRSVVVSGQLDSAVDIMGADRPLARAMELTENAVYLVGENLQVNSTK